MTCDLCDRESFARITTASTRRLILKAGSAAAVFGTLSTAACSPSPVFASDPRDPVLVAIQEYKAALDAFQAVGGSHIDELADHNDALVDAAADRLVDARYEVLNAVPTTRTGAEWLALFTANQADKIDSGIARAIDTFVAFMFANGARA